MKSSLSEAIKINGTNNTVPCHRLLIQLFIPINKLNSFKDMIHQEEK